MLNALPKQSVINLYSIHSIAALLRVPLKQAMIITQTKRFPKPCFPGLWSAYEVERFIDHEIYRFRLINDLCGTRIQPFKMGSELRAIWALHNADIDQQQLESVLVHADLKEMYLSIVREPKIVI